MNSFPMSVLSAGKHSTSSTGDPSGVAQGIPAAVDEDSIASLDEEDHMPGGMAAFHPSAPMDRPVEEEMFQGK